MLAIVSASLYDSVFLLKIVFKSKTSASYDYLFVLRATDSISVRNKYLYALLYLSNSKNFISSGPLQAHLMRCDSSCCSEHLLCACTLVCACMFVKKLLIVGVPFF